MREFLGLVNQISNREFVTSDIVTDRNYGSLPLLVHNVRPIKSHLLTFNNKLSHRRGIDCTILGWIV